MEMKRRDFLRGLLLATGATLVGGPLAASDFLNLSNEEKEIGIQLYTLRDAITADLADTLKKLAKIGYNTVEGYGYGEDGKFFGLTPTVFRALLEENNLRMLSTHCNFIEPEKAPAFIEGALKAGLEYLVIPALAKEKRETIDAYKRTAETFNKVGELCKREGLRFGYHNHAFEFETLDGQVPYDVLLAETDAQYVTMELDLFWITKAGKSPVAYFEANPGRFELWHLKDKTAGSEGVFVPLGQGEIDFKALYEHRETAGLKHAFVEQDKCEGDPFDCIRVSCEYIQKADFIR